MEFDTVVDFVSRAFSDQRQHEGAPSCNEVIGIVGDLDAKTASIVHTLASRANLNVTLVSAVAPSYQVQSQHLSIDNSFLAASNKPRGTILIRNIQDLNLEVHQTLVMLVFAFSFIFITTVFILYIIFRKEKEIKATSVTISMCMFLGCYILVLYLPLLLFSENSFSCHLLAWLSFIGIPFLLIMATLFAKMLRVYLIFSDPISYKQKIFSDRFLLLYIVLFVSPNFLVLVSGQALIL